MKLNNISTDTIKAIVNNPENPTYAGVGAIGVWHRPNSSGKETSLEGVCEVLDQMQRAGINIIFVEAFYHGMTLFKSTMVPYYCGFEKFDYGQYPDYLTAFSAEAEKRGIEVHAWVESFYLGVNPNAKLIKQYSHWLLINEHGSIHHTTEGADLGGYIFFDPANPQAQTFLLNFYDELLIKVPTIKGLNIDYIRYPVSDFYNDTDTGYTTISMSEFAKQYGLIINKNNVYQNFKEQIKEKLLVDKWIEYLAKHVTHFMQQLYSMINKKHLNYTISVAVHPDISNAYFQKKQDFLTWINLGYIDVITPMIYYYQTDQISSALKNMISQFNGVYCYSGLYTTFHNQSLTQLQAHINASNNCQADGFVLFETVKTFFNPAANYSKLLSTQYGASANCHALPHWNANKLINIFAGIIGKHLVNNGEKDNAVKTFIHKLYNMATINNSNAKTLEITIDKIIKLKNNKTLNSFSEKSALVISKQLDLLVHNLTIKKLRLSFKGC